MWRKEDCLTEKEGIQIAVETLKEISQNVIDMSWKKTGIETYRSVEGALQITESDYQDFMAEEHAQRQVLLETGEIDLEDLNFGTKVK